MQEPRPITNCYWVVCGKLLAGEYPRNFDDPTSREKVASLADAGVNVFIDLTEDGELFSYRQWLGTATHSRFPIKDGSIPRSAAQTVEILDAIDHHIDAGLTVYVHCWGGIGRTGTIIGCWLARHGYVGQDALDRLQELWQECPKSRYRKSPETPEQRDYILGWQENRQPTMARKQCIDSL